MWFKVTFNSDGAVKSCVAAGPSVAGGEYVRFVEAPNKTKAVERAKLSLYEMLGQEYPHWRPGFCVRCGAKVCEKIRCGACVARFNAGVRTARASRNQTFERKRQEREQAELAAALAELDGVRRPGFDLQTRHLLLSEVWTALQSRSPAAFRRWLMAQLSACERRSAS